MQVPPRWPAKLIVQCTEDDPKSSSRVVQRLPEILLDSARLYTQWMEEENKYEKDWEHNEGGDTERGDENGRYVKM